VNAGGRLTSARDQGRCRHRPRADRAAGRERAHLARDGREHAIKLLDALDAETDRWTLVDAAWTPKQKDGVNLDNDSAQLPA
jgi:hypothetical protein